MKFAENLALSKKLLLMLLIPVLVMLYFAGNQFIHTAGRYGESLRLIDLSRVGVLASQLVHELQKERGMTAGYLGSSGESFVQELAQQRELTDAVEASYHQYLSRSQVADELVPELVDMTRVIDGNLAERTTVRQRVDSLQVGLNEALTYYTALNGGLLDIVARQAALTSDKDLAMQTAAYANFLRGKERAGIERAVLANVFAQDRFPPGLYERLISLITIQDTYAKVFESLADEPALRIYRDTLQGEYMDKTQAMRDSALQRAAEGGFDIDPLYWFRMQTGKIELLKQIEDGLAHALIEGAEQHAGSAWHSLLLQGLLVALGVLLSIGMGVLLARSVYRQLGGEPAQIAAIAGEIARGNLELNLSRAGKRPSGIYAAMVEMQAELKRRTELERREAEQNARLKTALDSVSTNVIMTDTDYNIIYLNPAVESMFKQAEPAIRSELPGFEASKLLGANIDGFHRNPAHQRRLLDDIDATTRSRIEVGGLTLHVAASPVCDAQGVRMGTVVEWQNKTAEVAVEREIDAIVAAAKRGELGARIELSDKEGFFADLGRGMNEFIDMLERVFNDIAQTMRRMESGDLTTRITTEYRGSFASVKSSVNETMENLADIVSRVRDAADAISQGSDEIAAANNNLSSRTEQQAASIEETASTMEELTSTVRNNSDNSQQANQLARGALHKAEEGGSTVCKAVQAMEAINRASGKMSEIIGVIDEIAFQTNLLALNASVEAARAGEQGRGFSVVAGEVRTLAGRSAAAAREIKTLIQDSVGKVSDGNALVHASGKTLDEIIVSVKKVSDIISEIAAASQEQSSGIDQVNTSVSSMDELTQHNAALAEQTSAAAASMREKALEMNQLMGFFNVARER